MKNLIFTALILFYALPTLACTPLAEPQTLDTQIKEADIIFEGRVTAITKNTLLADITFEVQHYWKGHPEQKIVVQTGNNTCGISGVEPGDVMMIFAKGTPLMTDGFNGTFIIETAHGQKLRDTKTIEDMLGKGYAF